MSRIRHPRSLYSPPQLPHYMEESAPPSPTSSSRISPAILLVIVILSAVFFVCGLVQLLIRFIMKKKPSSSIYQSDRFAVSTRSQVLQRQLQQLFRLHDSGLDQTSIDALPVFYYKDIAGLKEPFDCAVCLCEFSRDDKLRLLPVCSHAFHINCIDTWLLSNSTCPLCRGTLASSGIGCNTNTSRLPFDMFPGDAEDAIQSVGKRVFSVRLGKFRSLNEEMREQQEESSRDLDPRRCYSMGSYQYVVWDLDLQVALSPEQNPGGFESEFCRTRGQNRACLDPRDSFSISKIWLWSNKNGNRLPKSSDIGISMSPCNVRLQEGSV